MSEQNQPSAIKFSLEETVSFRKGEEIGELISLSIEPDVTIHDLDQFISIRGSLRMYGEYKKNEDESREDEEFFSFSGQKFVTVLETREEGISEFQYDFPVDITIPKSRVRNLDDLDVIIDMFDYNIEEIDCLTVTTDVSIIGVEAEEATVYNREDLVESKEEERQEDQDASEYDNQLLAFDGMPTLAGDEEDTFVVEAKKEEREDEETQIPIQILPPTDDSVFGLKAPTDNLMTDSAKIKEDREEEQSHHEEKQESNEAELNLVEYVAGDDSSREEQSESEEEPQEAETDTNVTYLTPQAGQEQRDKDEVDSTPQIQAVDESEQAEDDLREEDERDSEDKNIKLHSHQDKEEKEAISLTQFFARKDENSVAKMKIYIVQEDDTLDDIAERYDISVSQILRHNDLEPHQDAYEGQVLYIPEKQKSHH